MRTEQFSKKYLAASVAAVFAVGGGVAMATTSTTISAAKTLNSTLTTTNVVINDIVIQELGQTGLTDGYLTIKIPSTVKLFEAVDGTAIARTTTALGSSSAPASLLVYPGLSSNTVGNTESYVFIGSTVTSTESTGGVELFKTFNTYSGNYIQKAQFSSSGTPLELANFATLGSAISTSDTTTVKVGQMYLDTATNDIVVTLAVKTSTTGNPETATIRGLRLGSTSAGTDAAVNVSLVDGNPLATTLPKAGLTESSTLKVLTLSSKAVSLAGTASTSTVPTIAAGGAAAQPTGVLTFTVVGDYTTNNNVLTISLDNGAKFHPTAATTLQSAITSSNATLQTDLRTSANSASIAVNSSGQLVLTMGTTDVTDGTTFVIPANTALTDASAMSAAATVTATAVGTGDTFAGISATAAVNAVATTGTTVAYVDTTTNGFTKLYSGRLLQTTDDTLTITELAPTSLLQGGTVLFTTSAGKFTASTLTAANTTGSLFTAGSVVSNSTTLTSTATTTIATATTTAAGKGAFSNFSFDLLTAAKGDLTVTVAGTAKAAGSAKLAEIIDATSSGAGTSVTGVAGAVVTLPDLTISETQATAIAAGNFGVLAKKDVISDFDISGATVKAFKADGVTDVTSSVFGVTTPTITKQTATNNTVGVYATTTAASSSTTGAVKIVIKGLKATLASGASGDVSVTLAGFAGTTPDLDVTVTGGTANEVGSNLGAKLTKATLKVATVASAGTPVIPAATVGGTVTAQTIAGQVIPAGNDTGAQGSIFLAAIVPVTGVGNVIVFNSVATGWVVFSNCNTAPAFSTGVLGSTNVDIVKVATDLSGLIGTQVYLGYGKGGALSPAGTACNNMLTNGTYNLIYTIK